MSCFFCGGSAADNGTIRAVTLRRVILAEFINKYLETYFDELEPLDFYRAIFQEGELEAKGQKEKGKYHGLAVELLPKAAENRKNVRRYAIYDDLEEIKRLLESNNFIIISPISYVGMSRKSDNARFIYALAIDLDGIEEEQNIIDLFHQINNRERIPKPTYIVSSGTGLHLYYQFEQPIPCFENIVKQLQRLKNDLTGLIWNGYVTVLFENVQYESLFQGFRMCGGVTKNGGRTRVFEIGDKVSIEYLNEFVLDKRNRVTEYTYISRLPLYAAKEKYPEWYEKRVVQKQPKGTWTTKKDLFYWWLERLKREVTVGHRYYCVMCLAVYAKKAGIEQDELEEIAFDLVEYLESLTEKDDNHFTREDILAALEMYNDNYIRFPIDSITKLTQIPIEKNKRNGRKQEVHIKRLNELRKFQRDVLGEDEYKLNGRPKKAYEVFRWKDEHPNGTPKECAIELGIGKSTIYRYWNYTKEESKEAVNQQLHKEILRRDKRNKK